MATTAPDPDLPDWLGHWALKALVPVVLAVGYVGLADAAPLEPAVFVAVFEAMLLFTHLDDAGRIGERAAKLGTGAVALAGAGLLVVAVDDGAFVPALLSLGLLSVGRAAAPDWEWSLAPDHQFSARDGDPPSGDSRSRDGDPPAADPVREAVLTALADRPHTRRELWEAVEGDADAIDEALATLRADGRISRAGSEFRLASPA